MIELLYTIDGKVGASATPKVATARPAGHPSRSHAASPAACPLALARSTSRPSSSSARSPTKFSSTTVRAEEQATPS